MSDQDPADDDLFETGNIFANRELLRVGHVPALERVVGRDDEINAVSQALAPAIHGGPPETIIIYGKTGTGKSLVSRCVTREAHSRTRETETTFEHAYVDCSDYQTETKASREFARELQSGLSADVDVPRLGLGAADYRDIAWDILGNHSVDACVVILDEIDKLDGDGILRSLSRAKESGKADTHIGVICISNKIEYRDRLNERVDSSLQDNELVFDPYDGTELEGILKHRRDAFVEDVLAEGVIAKTAALCAREHGDARKAVDTLYEAGRLAEREGDTQVTEAHVEDAIHRAEVNRFENLISGQPPHVQYILRALALLTENETGEYFRTTKIYSFYERLANHHGSEPLSQDRVYRLLKEQSFIGVTESHHTGGGPGEGSYLEHRLVRDPAVVIDALEQ